LMDSPNTLRRWIQTISEGIGRSHRNRIRGNVSRRKRSASELLEDRTLLSSVTADAFTVVSSGVAGQQSILHDKDWDAQAAPEWVGLFEGQRVVQTAGIDQKFISDDWVPIDVSKTYGLSGWARSGDNFGMRFSSLNQQSFGIEEYDADYLRIESIHVLKYGTASDTTLRAALNPGDTQILLTSAAGWSTSSDVSARALAWYGYANTAGTTYANYTYTRNVATGGVSGLWSPGGVNVASRVITLNAPWSGPAIPVGTAIRNATSGADHSTMVLNRQTVAGDFTPSEHAAIIGGGTAVNGSFAANRFAPGTAYVRPVILANQHGQTNNFVTWQDVRIQQLPSGAVVQDAKLPVIDMSVDLPGNQTVRLPLYSTGDTAYHIGIEARIQVSASQRYQLAVDSLDMTEEDLNPVGFYSYDADGKLIHSLHVTRHSTATDTRLARAVQPGDSAIYVSDATGWSNAIGSTAESRSLAWYGYQDGSGTIYADYTYTRNVAFDMLDGLWNVGGISFDSGLGAWKITLRNTWSGPSIASGTAVRNATGHDEIQLLQISTGRFLGHFETDPWSWTDYSAVIGGGLWQSGVPSERLLRPGTRFVQPALKSVTTRKFAVEFGPVSDRGLSEGASEATFADKAYSMLNRSRQLVQSDNIVPVSPTVTVTLSVDAAFGTTINAGETSSEQHSIGYLPFDADGLPIQSLHVARYASAVDTVLAQALNPGDTQIVLSNASGWSNVDVAGTRAIAWYDYRDSLGQLYPDYTYTRNVAADLVNGLWDLGAISGNLITLRQPWSGPALKMGTAVRNPVAGDDLIPAMRSNSSLPNSWTSYSATLSGTWVNGQKSLSSMPPGTAGLRIAVRANENNFVADEAIHIRNGKVTRSSGKTSTLQANSVTVATLDVLANDAVLSGNVSIIGLSTPKFGAVQVVAGAGSNGRAAVRYQSQSWFAGTDQFSYTVRDNATGENWTTTTTIAVAASNLLNDPSRSASISSQAAAPALHTAVPTDSSYSLSFWSQVGLYDIEAGRTLQANDEPVQSLLKYTVDGDNDVLAVQLVSGVGHGVLSLKANGIFEYTPEPGFVGVDSFEYLVTDGVNNWVRRVLINVRASNESLLSYRMSNIALAFHSFHDVNQRFGISGWTANASQFDAAGNPKLSWRVYLLPYLGFPDLFAKFRLDEAWNSPNNFPLLSQMPDLYRSPGDSPASTTTQFQTISDLQDLSTGKYLQQQSGYFTFARISGFVDGTTHSILFLQTGIDTAVPWTKPIDVDHDPSNPYSPLGNLPKDRLNVATADGAVRSYAKKDISAATLNALVTIAGGEILDAATLTRHDIQTQAGPKSGRGYGPAFGRVPTTQQQLKQLGLAMHNYHDVYNQFPLAGNTSVPGYRPGFDSNGKQLLSWRVHLLPYLEQRNLYEQFHFDEPWNSQHNLTLLDKMPDIYRSVDLAATSNVTRFKVLTGADALFKNTPFSYGPKLQQIVEMADCRFCWQMVLS
jgi:hypothetical protein